ncbi:LysE family transporter [Campylobacter insulaenigrae]|uniref:Transporter, LysE family n=1 Tax=Campylobacter insulaenigrae NCTC 12927 TaxID=1031564 RepID=A0A0A8H1W6_9BACT|nr:transporter, LysE family [Campylobacter insulaenigrae]AJC88076.1 transporter, LysE family [Campylobacter insulaenigrae NCTC 12927]VEH94760.1 LysE family amino acid transporter protein [Campylobacter insulaenigrae]
MLEIFLNGLILGMAVSVPFGPVNILILNTALSSFKSAFYIGFGALNADILFLILINFGVLNFIDNEIFHKILAIFGFLFLSFMVFLMLKNTKKINLNQIYKTHPIKGFAKGFFLNLTNPYVIGFWVSVAGLSVQSENSFALLCGLVGFIIFWIFALAFFVSKFKTLVKNKHIFYINFFSAIILEYFALSLLYKAFIG